MEPTTIWQYTYFHLLKETHPPTKTFLTTVKQSKCPKYSLFSNFYSLSKMGQNLGSLTNICICGKWQDTSCIPFQKLITTVHTPLRFGRHLEKKKLLCNEPRIQSSWHGSHRKSCDGSFEVEPPQWQHTNCWTVISIHNTAIKVNGPTQQKSHT